MGLTNASRLVVVLVGTLALAVGPAQASIDHPFTLTRAPGSPHPAGKPLSLALAHLNADPYPDLVAGDGAQTYWENATSVWTGGPGGTFGPESVGNATARGDARYRLSTGDVNGDGFTDAVSRVTGEVTVQLGTGSGTFEDLRRGTLVDCQPPLAVADLNRDGRDDVACGGNGPILLSSGDGTFTGGPTQLTVAGTESIDALDVDDDGHQDLVAVAESTVRTFLGDGTGVFTARPVIASRPASPTPSAAFGFADMNRDGHPDLVGPSYAELVVMLGDGQGGFEASGTPPLEVDGTMGGGAIADFDRDGLADVAVSAGGGVQVFLGDGMGALTLSRATIRPAGRLPGGVVSADFDGDARPDLAATDPSRADLSVWLNRATTAWDRPAPAPVIWPSLIGPSRCVKRGTPATYTVRGTAILSVRFTLAGGRHAERTHPNAARDGFRVSYGINGLKRGTKHALTAVVRRWTSRAPSTVTLHRTLKIC